jgi:outer membrane protein assembly factor BamD (BamD/ComL family)
MAHEKRPLKVFLCHASGDKPPVRDLYKRLSAEGVDAWLDKEKLLPGQDWRLEIPKAVKEADVVVVCLSDKSVTKEGYVQKEIKFALDIAEEKPEGTIFLIPARLEDCAVPERLSRWQWVDLYEENGFIQLLRSLKLRADAVGATVEPTLYVDSDKETEHRLDQLYTEGLAAFYTEDWDRACQRFQSILNEQPNHKNAAEKLADAERQRNLSRLYAQASETVRSEDWESAIKTLEELTQKSPDYKDAASLLRNARKQKQLRELYTEAGKLHAAQKWEAVVKVFEQIAVIEPNYPDPNGLLPSAQKEVAELQRLAGLNRQYSQGVREMDAGNWVEARRLLETVHKSQTGFLETERLLRKAEDEILKMEEQVRRAEQVNVLYEQAHGLLRSKKWRNALDKMEEIRKLDDHFPDTDGIAEKARMELAREEQEAERQNQLAALYAEAVRLLKEEKYQEALDKWGEVRAIDQQYPDRQWVGRTAKRKLAETTKPVQIKPRFVMSRQFWMGIAGLIVVGAVITGVILSGRENQGVASVMTKASTQTSALHPATSAPAASNYTDPTMYDDFNNPSYDGLDSGSYNRSLWSVYARSSDYRIWQYGGDLHVKVFDQADAGLEANDFLYIDKPAFVEISMHLDPSTTDNDSHFYSYLYIQDHGGINCGIFSHENDTQDIKCWSEFYGKMVEANLGLDGIPPAWHVIRLEIEPETMTISYIIDGRKVGAFVPKDSIPEHFNDFKQSNFHFKFAINNFGPSTAPHGYVDYVRMGAIEDDPNILVYDNFNSSTYDGSYDKSKWEACGWDSGSTVVQNNGILSITHTRIGSGYQATTLCPYTFKSRSINFPTYFEARLMVPSDYSGSVGFAIEETPAWQNLHTRCEIEHSLQSNGNPQTLLKCFYITLKNTWNSHTKDMKPNTWYTIRIEVYPATNTFYSYLDGQQFDMSNPGVDFSQINWLFSMYVANNQTKQAAGYFDDVRIGILKQ